jgi:hypothetical protein
MSQPHLWAHVLQNVGASTAQSPTGPHCLLRGHLHLIVLKAQQMLQNNDCEGLRVVKQSNLRAAERGASKRGPAVGGRTSPTSDALTLQWDMSYVSANNVEESKALPVTDHGGPVEVNILEAVRLVICPTSF